MNMNYPKVPCSLLSPRFCTCSSLCLEGFCSSPACLMPIHSSSTVSLEVTASGGHIRHEA